MMHVLIVDDEPLARENIRALLEAEDDIGRIDECGSGRDAIRRILDDTPDLVFLDVQMPNVDGMAVIEAVGVERMPAVVFITAHDEYAVRAFEAAAVDYLLKPFNDERFRRALRRARAAFAARADRQVVERLQSLLDATGLARTEPDSGAARAEPVRRLAVPDGEATILLDPAEIDWIEAVDYYVRLHVGKRSYLLRQSLSELEARLEGDAFVRIHRSTIVRIDRVHALRPNGRGGHQVVLRDGTRLELSRRRRPAIERLVGRLG